MVGLAWGQFFRLLFDENSVLDSDDDNDEHGIGKNTVLEDIIILVG